VPDVHEIWVRRLFQRWQAAGAWGPGHCTAMLVFVLVLGEFVSNAELGVLLPEVVVVVTLVTGISQAIRICGHVKRSRVQTGMIAKSRGF
jgi:hypothetical protein